MHSHSFQDTELKLHRYVNDYPEQVAKGLTIPRCPVGLRNKGLINKKPKFDMRSKSFQDTELKLHRYVNDTPEQVMDGLTIYMLSLKGL